MSTLPSRSIARSLSAAASSDRGPAVSGHTDAVGHKWTMDFDRTRWCFERHPLYCFEQPPTP